MAVTECQIERPTRSATFAPAGTRTYTETYKIRTDNRFWGPAQVWSAAQTLTRSSTISPLPSLHESYKEYDGTSLLFADVGIYMMSCQLAQDKDNPFEWKATANYRKLTGDENSDSDVTAPLRLPIKYWLEFASTTEVVREAVNVEAIGPENDRAAGENGPILNGALQDFDEPLEGVRHRVFLNAEKPVLSLGGLTSINATFDGTENSDTFYDHAPGHARYAGLSSSRELDLNGIKYYLATIRVELSKTRYETKVINRGYKYFASVEDATTYTYTATEFAEPSLLDKQGFLLGDGEFGNTITYRDLTPIAYSGLGI